MTDGSDEGKGAMGQGRHVVSTAPADRLSPRRAAHRIFVARGRSRTAIFLL